MNAQSTHDQELAHLIALRCELHRKPETGFEVEATATVAAEQLRACGLTVETDVGGGVVATLRCGTGTRAVALRAELDALPITEATNLDRRSLIPGKFHGCGHDGHMAMLIGAALQLARQRDFDGTVHFVFQPDEENGRGAQAMIEAGFFERFPTDAIYGLHNMPGMPLGSFATGPGVFTAFEDRFEIRIEGRGGHSSTPECTIDPMLPAAELVLAAQSIVGRAISPRDHAVVSITDIVTDGAWNVIPNTVTLRGDARGYLKSTLEAIAAGHPKSRIDDLLPWNLQPSS